LSVSEESVYEDRAKNQEPLRLKKGLTQEELGERTDLTKGYISQIERRPELAVA